MTTYHFKYREVKTLISANQPMLLTGERGSGKTTLIMDVAKSLGLEFYCMSMTRQTTLSHLLGFRNVNGIYVSSYLREAAEFGGVFLLDELDAADPNVILSLNTIENGFISFPDKAIELHEDFRLAATSNPQGNHRDYNGRSKLDAATLDRFDIVDIERDDILEKTLVDFNTFSHISLMREELKKSNSSTYISMRDSLKFQKRKNLGLLGGFVKRLLKNDLTAYENYQINKSKIPKVADVSECKNLEEVWDFVKSQN